ncbi:MULTISPECIES: transposase family protein [Streptomyces]|uniref:transposase family protein n=1 Tax=Streptomyces TaxID=1883 RepID=UPI001FFDD45F|nr:MULTISPECIES: transposase family protein [Streptomyces]MDX3344406.1 transposase family protein [Streptomyces sp. ME02-6979A]
MQVHRRRWRDELIILLAARAPRLDRALKKVVRQGGRSSRSTAPSSPPSAAAPGRPTGELLRQTPQSRPALPHPDRRERPPELDSAARPGRTHDNTAARHDHILAHLRAAGLGALADLGFRGLYNDVRDPVIDTGFHASRTQKLTAGQKNAHRVLAIGRAPVEHCFAHLKNRRILAKLRTDPGHATQLLRALLVLTNLEVNRRRR